MAKTCLICNIFNSQMMSIREHPKDLSFKLEFVLEYQAKENDFLCYTCYEELIIAFNFKQKCFQSKLNCPEFRTITKNESGTSEKDYLKYSPTPSLLEVKIEPNFDSEDSTSILIGFSDDDYDDDIADFSRQYFKREKSVDITSDADEAEDTINTDRIEEPATSKISKKKTL